MAGALEYLELWTRLEADGGTRLGRFLPIAPQRTLRLTGDDVLQFQLPKTHVLAASIARNAVIREILSPDGATWREWLIVRHGMVTGVAPLLSVECGSVLLSLVNVPVSTSDADGFVYTDTGAIQLPPATIIDDYLLAHAPSFWQAGTVTPTENAEVPFSGDSALSGGRRLEEAVPGYELSATPNGTTAYDLNYTVRGASAATLYLRTGKQLKGVQRDVVPGQITRLTQIQGASSDDGPAGIAWAYWEVLATSGAGPYLVTLGAIHGGAGPIAFDDQLNHSGLPGGANSLYLEKADGTTIQITDSIASTQQVQVSSLTGISTGDWVRIVASSTGLHLTSLDAPAELATTGVLGGRYESAWDDAVCVLKNSLQEAWASTLPDNWTGLGAKTTTAGEWITSGAALHIDQSVSDGTQIAAPPARSWYIRSRRTTWSAVAWIRLLSATSVGEISFRVKVGSTVIGEALKYTSPANVWRQLKIEGLDLSAYVGTTVTLTAEIVKSGGTGTVDMLVDSICLTPSLAARAVTAGSNAARTWQGANAFLDVQRGAQYTYRASLADLDRMGRANQQPIVVGGTAIFQEDELGTITTRVLEVTDAPDDPGDATVTFATLPSRFTRAQSKPLALTIPFFDPIQVRVADRDTRNAALLLKAEVTASDETSVTVSLTATDSLGGTPSIAYTVFGATYVSGSGTGPYVFTKPGATTGVGRAVFTATLDGRSDVYDAVDIPEQAATGPSLDVRATPGASNYTITWSGDGVELAIDGGSYGSPPSSPITVARNSAGGAAKEYTFRATLSGVTAVDSVTIPPIDKDTVTPDLAVSPGTNDETESRFTVTGSNPSGGSAPTITVLLKNCGGSSDLNGTITTDVEKTLTSGAVVTVIRPSWGTAQASAVFKATLSGGGTEIIQRTIPNQDRTNFGPNLLVTVTPGSTSYSLAYTAESGATLTYSIDGGSYSALGSSPLVVSRNAYGGADQTVTIKAEYEGITDSQAFLVPVQAGTGGGDGTTPPSIDTLDAGAQDDTGDYLPLTWTVSNAPASPTYDLRWSTEANGGQDGTITGITSTYNFNMTTYGGIDLVAKGTPSAQLATYALTLRMKDGSTTVATRTLTTSVWYLP